MHGLAFSLPNYRVLGPFEEKVYRPSAPLLQHLSDRFSPQVNLYPLAMMRER